MLTEQPELAGVFVTRLLFILLTPLVLGIRGSDGARQAFVRTEAELHVAVRDSHVVEIIILADLHVRSNQLRSQQSISTRLGGHRPPLWVSQPAVAYDPVPIERHLLIRSDAPVYTSPLPGLSRTPGTAISHGLPQLDLTYVQGWLRLLPNATLKLRGLHLTTSITHQQPDLQPYRALLRALLAFPATAAATASVSIEQRRLLVISLESCIESVNIGLPQGLADEAARALPPLPDAVATAATAAAVAAAHSGAWADLPTPASVAVDLELTSAQLCLGSAVSDSSSTAGSDNSGSRNDDNTGSVQVHLHAWEGTRQAWPRGRLRSESESIPKPQPVAKPQTHRGTQPLSQSNRRRGRVAYEPVAWPEKRATGLLAEGICWLMRKLLVRMQLSGLLPALLAHLDFLWRLCSGKLGFGPVRSPASASYLMRDAGSGGVWGSRTVHSGDDGAEGGDGRFAPSDAGAACLGGVVLVGRAATAMAFSLADGPAAGGGLVAITDDFLAAAGGRARSQTSGDGGRVSYGHIAEQYATPTLLLLLVGGSFSASIAQVDEACMRGASAITAECVQRAAASLRLQERLLDEDTGVRPPAPAPPAAPASPYRAALPPASSGNSAAASFKIALWVVLTAAVVLLTMLVAVLCKYRRLQRQHNRERGAQSAPGVGPLTTLLITDIANSTGLWESLPEEVMDQALKLHHACLRALMQRFNGYESATEGDSFILAFHYPADAAKFALSAQIQLMDVMWPAEVMAHPDAQEVWVVPRSADMPRAGALQPHLSQTLGSSIVADGLGGGAGGGSNGGFAAGRGASMSVQRSSGAGTVAIAGAGATIGLRARDVGYNSGGGFLRGSWTGRAKSFKGPGSLGGGYVPALVRPGGGGCIGATMRSEEVDRMSPSELDTDEMTYGPEGHTGTGSGLFRSFTSRMTSILGLSPPAGEGGGGGGSSGAGASGRAPSRMGRFLRITASAAVAGGGGPEDIAYRPVSMQTFTDRSMPGSGSLRRGCLGGGGGAVAVAVSGSVEATFSRQTRLSKSFAGRLLARGSPAQLPLPPPRLGAAAGPASGSGHGSVALALSAAQSTTPSGSFANGMCSLLRQALSFNRRHDGSFPAPSRAASAASAVATAATASGGVGSGCGGGAVQEATPLVTATTGSSIGSPAASRDHISSYRNMPASLPPSDNVAAATDLPRPDGVTRRSSVDDGQLSEASIGSLTYGADGGGRASAGVGGGIGCSASNISKGGLTRSGLLQVGRSGAAGGSAGRWLTMSASSLLRTAPAGTMLAAAAEVISCAPSVRAQALSPGGRQQWSGVGGSGGSGNAGAAFGTILGRCTPHSAVGRGPAASASGANQRRRQRHLHGLYGDVVAGVAYGRGAAPHSRIRSSCDGSLMAGALVLNSDVASEVAADATEAAAAAAAAEAVAAAATSTTDGGGDGGCKRQANAFTEYESGCTTGPILNSILAAGSSGSSGIAADDGLGRQFSNATAMLEMEMLRGDVSFGIGGDGTRAAGVVVHDAPRQPAPRVPQPQFRSALLFEGLRGGGGGLSLMPLQRANVRRASAPADGGLALAKAALAATAPLAAKASAPPSQLQAPSSVSASVTAAGAVNSHGAGGHGEDARTATTAAEGCTEGGSSRESGADGGSIGGGGGGSGTAAIRQLPLPLVGAGAGDRPSFAVLPCVESSPDAGGSDRMERTPMVVTHNQSCDVDSATHVRVDSCELRVSDSLRLLGMTTAPFQASGAASLAGGPSGNAADPGRMPTPAAAVAAAKSPAAVPAYGTAATTAATADGSRPSPRSQEIAGTGSGPDDGAEINTITATTYVCSESVGIASSFCCGPGTIATVAHPRAAMPGPDTILPTAGGGKGCPDGSSSLSATLAHLLRGHGHDTRVHSSSNIRSTNLDGGAATTATSSAGAGTIPKRGAGGDDAQQLQPQRYPRWRVRVPSSGAAGDPSGLLCADAHSGGGGSSSVGQLPTFASGPSGSAGRSNGSGSHRRGSASGGSNDAAVAATGLSPPLTRSGSLNISVSQKLARGWSRANTLVRQLTRDRIVSRMARNSAADYAGSGDAPVVGSAAASGRIEAVVGGASGAGAASGLLLTANALLAASDAEVDSGVELSAMGILSDGVRLRLGGCGDGQGSANCSGWRSKLHTAPVESSGAATSGDEGPPATKGEAEGGRHRLSAQMMTIDLGAALAAADGNDSSALPPGPTSAKPPSELALPLPRVASSTGHVSAVQVLTVDGLGNVGNGSGRTATVSRGTTSALALTLPAPATGTVMPGPASRRISFLGLGLVQRSRTAERRSSATGEWQGEATAPLLGGTASMTGFNSQSLPAVAADCRSWREKCREEWPPAHRPAPPARCAYRGLRVRMGLHTGITTASDVTFNPTTSHMAYGGTAMKVAKAVGDAAAGGMILMSQSTFQALVGAMMELPGTPQAVFSGESSLDLCPGSAAAHCCLYQLVHRELVQRLGYAAPLRNVRLTQLGTEDAPTGFCAISFMHVASASMLVAELGQPGVEALQQFKAIATELCSRCGGYVVEASEGLCLAAFRHAAAALVWALASREALESHPWSAEVRRWYRSALGNSMHAISRGGRGPRPRTGVHVGGVNVEVNAATGRLTYRGKVMNRTSRIAHKASSEQIVCSKEAWDAVEASLQRMVVDIRDERRLREEEAMMEAAAAAARAAVVPGSSTADGDGEGVDEGYGAEDILSDLSPNTTPPSTRKLLIGGGGSAAAAAMSGVPAARNGSPPLTRSGIVGSRHTGRGGSKPASAPSSALRAVRPGQIAAAAAEGSGAVSEGFSRIKASSMAASLAASMRAHRSASAKHLSAAAAAAVALTRRVTSFSTRVSLTSLPDITHNGVAGRVPSIPARAGGVAMAVASPVRLAPAPATYPQLGSPQAIPSPPLQGSAAGFPSQLTPGIDAASPAEAAALPFPSAATLPLTYQSSLGPAGQPGTGAGSGQGEVASSPCGGGSGCASGAVTTCTAAADSGGAGGGGGGSANCRPPPSSLQWQALSRLVGPRVELPPAKRLEARFLGSYSLKGVREEMRLFEVAWADEEGGGDEDEDMMDNNGQHEGGTIAGGGGGGDGIFKSASSTPAPGQSSSARGFMALAASHSPSASPAVIGADAGPNRGRAQGASAPSRAPAAAAADGTELPLLLPRMVRQAPTEAGQSSLPFMIADVAQLRGGGPPANASVDGSPAAQPSPAAPRLLQMQPVVVSSAAFWIPRSRGAVPDWQVTDTGCSVYEVNATGGVMQPAEEADLSLPQRQQPAAAEWLLAGSYGTDTGGGSASGRLLLLRGSAESPRAPDSGGGGGGFSGTDEGSQQRLQQLQQQARDAVWPGPSPPFLAAEQPPFSLYEPYKSTPEQHRQLPPRQRHARPQQQQLRLRSSLRPVSLPGAGFHTSHRSPSRYTSPNITSSPCPGGGVGGGGHDTNSSVGNHRRRQLASGLGVTFADPPLRRDLPGLGGQPPAATAFSTHQMQEQAHSTLSTLSSLSSRSSTLQRSVPVAAAACVPSSWASATGPAGLQYDAGGDGRAASTQFDHVGGNVNRDVAAGRLQLGCEGEGQRPSAAMDRAWNPEAAAPSPSTPCPLSALTQPRTQSSTLQSAFRL